ncbi:MAG TPA: thiol:disulfide interchange protein DsbA/DsbL [Hyphomicrobiales bacterium]|nr:thiol:disulfide interchange protein DsbA/DsbL [Hyphomicrobiales bacterium]
MPRRTLLTLAAGAATLPAFGQPARHVAGTHYDTLPDNALSQQQRDSAAPLVTEVFWYGCPHCYEFDPLLANWVQEQGANIAFTRQPAVWDAATRVHARLFAATLELGIHAQVHEAIFSAIHEQRNYLLDDASQLAFLQTQGVSEAAANKALRSFQVDSQIRKAESLVRELRVPGIPAMIVQGRYMVKTSNAVRTYGDVLDVCESLLKLDA